MAARYVHTNLIAHDWETLARFYVQVLVAPLSNQNATSVASGSNGAPPCREPTFVASIFACPAMDPMGQRSRSTPTTTCLRNLSLRPTARDSPISTVPVTVTAGGLSAG